MQLTVAVPAYGAAQETLPNAGTLPPPGFDIADKIDEEPEPVKGIPTKAQKQPVKANQNDPMQVRKSSRVKKVTPSDLVNNRIKVRFENGKWYTGEVRSYKQPVHSVYFSYDNTTERQNFFFPDKPNYVTRDNWKLI